MFRDDGWDGAYGRRGEPKTWRCAVCKQEQYEKDIYGSYRLPSGWEFLPDRWQSNSSRSDVFCRKCADDYRRSQEITPQGFDGDYRGMSKAPYKMPPTTDVYYECRECGQEEYGDREKTGGRCYPCYLDSSFRGADPVFPVRKYDAFDISKAKPPPLAPQEPAPKPKKTFSDELAAAMGGVDNGYFTKDLLNKVVAAARIPDPQPKPPPSAPAPKKTEPQKTEIKRRMRGLEIDWDKDK